MKKMEEKKVIDNGVKTPAQIKAEEKAKKLQEAQEVINAHNSEKTKACAEEINAVLQKHGCRFKCAQTVELPETSMSVQVVVK